MQVEWTRAPSSLQCDWNGYGTQCNQTAPGALFSAADGGAGRRARSCPAGGCPGRTSTRSPDATPCEPGGSVCCYWNGYITQCSHPAQEDSLMPLPTVARHQRDEQPLSTLPVCHLFSAAGLSYPKSLRLHPRGDQPPSAERSKQETIVAQKTPDGETAIGEARTTRRPTAAP